MERSENGSVYLLTYKKPERGKRNEDWILVKDDKSCVQRQVLKPMKQACIDIDLAGGGLPGDWGKEYE